MTTSNAGAGPMLQKGARELAIHVSPDFEGAIGDTISADAGFGWFVRDRIVLRGVLDYEILEDVAGADADYRTSGLGVAAEYHFGHGETLVPYLGLGLGWRSTHFGEHEEAAMVYGPRAGLKVFLADNVALDCEAIYELGAADVFVNDFVPEDSDLRTLIGLRFYF
jgi:hypothetical protein